MNGSSRSAGRSGTATAPGATSSFAFPPLTVTLITPASTRVCAREAMAIGVSAAAARARSAVAIRSMCAMRRSASSCWRATASVLAEASRPSVPRKPASAVSCCAMYICLASMAVARSSALRASARRRWISAIARSPLEVSAQPVRSRRAPSAGSGRAKPTFLDERGRIGPAMVALNASLGNLLVRSRSPGLPLRLGATRASSPSLAFLAARIQPWSPLHRLSSA